MGLDIDRGSRSAPATAALAALPGRDPSERERCARRARAARAARAAGVAVVLVACAHLAPLREPPRLGWDDPPSAARTRAELVTLFGPPAALLFSDRGLELLYRRPITLDYTPSRFPIAHAEEAWFRVQLDQEDHIVGWSRERHLAASE